MVFTLNTDLAKSVNTLHQKGRRMQYGRYGSKGKNDNSWSCIKVSNIDQKIK